MSKEEIRVGLLNEQYPPEMVDWALEKVLTAEENQLELLSTLREWNERGLPRNNRAMAGMATTAPCAQDLEWRPGEFLEEVNGVVQMRKGIAKELQNYLNEAEELLVEH